MGSITHLDCTRGQIDRGQHHSTQRKPHYPILCRDDEVVLDAGEKKLLPMHQQQPSSCSPDSKHEPDKLPKSVLKDNIVIVPQKEAQNPPPIHRSKRAGITKSIEGIAGASLRHLCPQTWKPNHEKRQTPSIRVASPAVSCSADPGGQTQPREGIARRRARSGPASSSPSSDQGLEARDHSRRRPLLPMPPPPPSPDRPRHHASSGRSCRRCRHPHHCQNRRPHPAQMLGGLALPTTRTLPRRAAGGTARAARPASPGSGARESCRGTICALHRKSWCGAVGSS